MVSPILHYTQIQGNEGQFMCIQKFPSEENLTFNSRLTWILEDNDPAQVVSQTVTANPFANPAISDFGALPTGNSPMPGFNLQVDFPETFQLSLYDFRKSIARNIIS